MTTYRIKGIDYDFERHHISDTGNDRIPAGWLYFIKPPNDSIGGLDSNNPRDQAYIADVLAAGFIEVSSKIYDEFLRSRLMKAVKAGNHAQYVQERYNIQRARVELYEIDESQFTWAEWAEYQPDSLGYYGIDPDGYLDLLRVDIDDKNKGKASRVQGGQAQLTG